MLKIITVQIKALRFKKNYKLYFFLHKALGAFFFKISKY